MPRGVVLREHDIADLMGRYKRLRKDGWRIKEACQKIALDLGMSEDGVYRIVRRLNPSTDVAGDYLRANSLKLAMRVVRKANVDQAIGVLKNPRVGVLDPDGAGGGFASGKQFIIGVAMDSLGGVKVGVQIGDGKLGPASGPLLGEGSQLDRGSTLRADGETVGPDVCEGEIEANPTGDGDSEDLPPRPQNWWEKAPPPPKIDPVPVNPNRIMGQKMAVRLAEAKANRKAAVKQKRRDREDLKARMKWMQAEMRGQNEK